MAKAQAQPIQLELEPYGHYTTPTATAFEGVGNPVGKSLAHIRFRLPDERILDIPLTQEVLTAIERYFSPREGPPPDSNGDLYG